MHNVYIFKLWVSLGLGLGFFRVHTFTLLLAGHFQYSLRLWARVQFWAMCGEMRSDCGSPLQCFRRNGCCMFPVSFFLHLTVSALYTGEFFSLEEPQEFPSVCHQMSEVWSPPYHLSITACWTKMPSLLDWSKSHSEVLFSKVHKHYLDAHDVCLDL